LLFFLAIYHHYDGVIYPHPEELSKWNPKNWFRYSEFDRNQVLKYRQYAALMFLPRWKGFVVEYEQMLATEAIEKTLAISEGLENVYISLGYNQKKRTVNGLDFNKVRRHTKKKHTKKSYSIFYCRYV
jgi:hypothetical protein